MNVLKNVCNNNIELACSLMQKTVIDKALEDIKSDKFIIAEIEKRKLAKEKGLFIFILKHKEYNMLMRKKKAQLE